VILIPTTVVMAVVFMVKPEWFSRYGIALAVVSIAAMSSIFLTMQAGAALSAALHLQGRAANLISQHSQAAHILAYIYVVFTATLIVTFAARRISGGMPTGLAIVDRPLAPNSVFAALRILLVVLAIAVGYMVFRTGDLGAKAVWQGRIQAAQAFGRPRRMPSDLSSVRMGPRSDSASRKDPSSGRCGVRRRALRSKAAVQHALEAFLT
jgi:hypothetical protein